MQQIKNGFDDRYYLTPDGKVIDTLENKQLKMSEKHRFTLRNTEGKQIRIALKPLYRLVYDKEYCIDNIESLKNEEWKEVEGSEGKYYVSNQGRIKSYTKYEAIILKPTITRKGYERLQLYINGITSSLFVHRIVAAAFLPVPESINFQLHHIDKNPRNNKAENLVWLSPKDHQQLHRKLEEMKNAKLSDLSESKEDIHNRQRAS